MPILGERPSGMTSVDRYQRDAARSTAHQAETGNVGSCRRILFAASASAQLRQVTYLTAQRQCSFSALHHRKALKWLAKADVAKSGASDCAQSLLDSMMAVEEQKSLVHGHVEYLMDGADPCSEPRGHLFEIVRPPQCSQGVSNICQNCISTVTIPSPSQMWHRPPRALLKLKRGR